MYLLTSINVNREEISFTIDSVHQLWDYVILGKFYNFWN